MYSRIFLNFVVLNLTRVNFILFLSLGGARQRDPLEHRQRDEHGHGASQPRQDELLAADAGLLELRSGELQTSPSTHLQGRALKKPLARVATKKS